MRFFLLIAILFFAVAAIAQPVGTVSPSSVNFGSLLLNETSAEKTIKLKNTGDAELVISNVSVTAPFSVVANKCVKVKQGATCMVSIAYTPQSAETASGTLTFTDNASNTPQTASLTGVGLVFKTLYTFPVASAPVGDWRGLFPDGSLTLDPKGNFYGPTNWGGKSDIGAIFKLTSSGTETVLHSFSGPPNDGSYPWAGMTADAEGNLYGTTVNGGNSSDGAIYKVTPTGTETVLHSFSGSPNDGEGPRAGLTLYAGNFYGTTTQGGASDCGTVFEVTPGGTETVLYSFCSQPNAADGSDPWAAPIMDSQGNLYGTTSGGGSSSNCRGGACGTIFQLTPDGTETVLYSFNGYPTDGTSPLGGLVMDAQGNFYGTTSAGGSSASCSGVGYVGGCGTVFKVTPGGTETVLYNFCSQPRCTDGYYPGSGLVADAAGNLYGTTESGGAYGDGTVFKVAPGGTETVLYSFCSQPNCTDGYYPVGGLIVDAAGNLFGTTQAGGDHGKSATQGGGTVFGVVP